MTRASARVNGLVRVKLTIRVRLKLGQTFASGLTLINKRFYLSIYFLYLYQLKIHASHTFIYLIRKHRGKIFKATCLPE